MTRLTLARFASVLPILALAAGSVATIPPLPASAGPSPIADLLCAPRKQMTEKLERQFGVRRQGVGMRSPDQVMELWSKPDNGDWTLVIAYATGTSCIVAMGEHWTALPSEAG